MNAISLLGSMLPSQAWQPAAGAAAPAANSAGDASQVPASQVPDNGTIGGLQELAASLQGLRGVADTLRAQLESMLGDTSGASSVASSVSASLSQRASFQFVTQEGDVVDLTVRSRASISSSAASVQDATGSASASRTTVIASARLSVQVHGNLNDKELAAIKDVLGQVETLADKFFGGDVQAAFAASASLQIDSTQLASMSLDLSSRLRVRGAAQSTIAAAPDVVGSGAPATTTPAVTTDPAATTTSAAAIPAPQTVALPAVTTAAANTAAPTASVQPALDYLANVLQQFQNVASIELSMKAKLQMLLIAVMPAAKAPEATAGSAAAAGAPATSVVATPGVAALGQLSNATTLAA